MAFDDLEELLDQLDGDDFDEQYDTESYGPLGSTGPLLETSWADGVYYPVDASGNYTT